MSILSSDIETLSHEAYVYLYPLVTMEVTRLQAINLEADAKPGFGPANEFHHIREFPPASFRAVVRPNFDTLYSITWLDLTNGPVLLKAADTGDRYYMLPLLDMWTDVFATTGKRTTGTGDQEFVVVGPGYQGDVPEGVSVINAPTPWVWVIGRTQTNGPADYAAVHAVQDGYVVEPLAPAPPHVIDTDHDTTTEAKNIVNQMSATEFFVTAAKALKVNPPHMSDFSIIARIAQLGIAPGQDFDPSRFSEGDLTKLQAGATGALQSILAALPTVGTRANGWNTVTSNIGTYGNDYFMRAVVALIGLGANPPEDATYPLLVADADGEPLVGEQDYVIHFDSDALPPANAFWSVTMYDADGFQAANELDRFAIGDRDALSYNPDGSLDLYIQHTHPGPEREANWLPAPLGPLGITLRLYAPKPEALNGTWLPPLVRKA